VLGSGGPIADDERASAGYVVWSDGRARLLVDLGGGTFQRLGASGARTEGLAAVLLTHLHVDHVAGLPALLKSASFGRRSETLPIIGPSGSGRFPGTRELVDTMLDPDSGAFRYLSPYLERGRPFSLKTREIDPASEIAATFESEGLKIRAIGVPHGAVPALGYSVQIDDTHLVFTGDQRMDEDRFAELAQHPDLLVAHHAIPPEASDAARELHATPEAIGRLAAKTDAKRLVLSHLMRRSLEERARSRAAIESHYGGHLSYAVDLACYAVAGDESETIGR
jgi:ribonuclease BN (tRNA processing enzyme)